MNKSFCHYDSKHNRCARKATEHPSSFLKSQPRGHSVISNMPHLPRKDLFHYPSIHEISFPLSQYFPP